MGANTEMMRLDSVEKDTMESILNAQTLPKTSSTDNGKVLTVVGGKWAKAEASGGGSVEVFDVLATPQDDTYVCTSTKTFQELASAYSDGKALMCRLTIADTIAPERFWYRLTLQMQEYSLESRITFSATTRSIVNGGIGKVYFVGLSSDGSITFNQVYPT